MEIGGANMPLAYNPPTMPSPLSPTPARLAPAASPAPGRGLWGWVLPLLGLALALALRLYGLDRFIASDELRWTCRSLNFRGALLAGRPAETFQVGHPGVATMALGAAAAAVTPLGDLPALCRDTAGGTDFDRLDDRGQEGRMRGFAAPLFGLRRGMAWGSTLLLGLLYLLLRRGLRWPLAAALGALLLLATDPFMTAHSRVLHVDAPVTLLSLAAVLTLASALLRPGPPPAWLALAGALAAAAALAKSSALLLGPFGLLALLWWARSTRAAADATGQRISEDGARSARSATRLGAQALRAFGPWLLAAILAYTALWPAMWVDPWGTLFRGCTAEQEEAGCRPGVLAKAAEEGGQPHQSGNYFLGQPVADPGLAFYPLALAFRLAPLAALLLLAQAWLALRSRLALLLRRRRPEPAGRGSGEATGSGGLLASGEADCPLLLPGQSLILAWALAFVLAVSLGPKKFDRYALPAQAALTLLAGAWAGGWAQGAAARLARRGDRSRGREAGPVALGAGLLALVALQALGWRAAGPDSLRYPLMAYNPLLGGAPSAARLLLVGWGEGYDLAAAWLNRRPSAAEEQTAVRGLANFAPLYGGAARSTAGYEPGRTDFVVFYRSEVQRRHPDSAGLLSLLQDPPEARPLYVGAINGLPMVWVHANPTVAPLAAAIEARVAADEVLIAGGETVYARSYAGRRTLLRYWGHQDAAALRSELVPALPEGWRRAWVIRYPGNDPEAILTLLEGLARRGETHTIRFADGSSVELTSFEPRP